MKKIVIALCLSSFFFGYSQEKEFTSIEKNELKANVFLFVLNPIEITYERILNEDSGIGTSVYFMKKGDADINFSLTPYYRAYFGKKPAAGFFVEGFSMLSTGINNKTYYFNNSGNLINIEKDRYTDFALGFGLGSKWVHKRGFVFEINAGIGRNLFSNNSPEVVGRGGISLGYRF